MTEDCLFRTQVELSVNFPERTIDLIVIPYNSEAMVEYHPLMGRRPGGRIGPVIERVAAGAFAGIEKRANRIKVNRDHVRDRPVGRAVVFHPDDERGLFGRLRISRTDLGDETLQLADDQVLAASAGFRPMAGESRWLDRDHVEYQKCWLDHVAMTADPAHVGTDVIAVRHVDPGRPREAAERVATPNLDAVLAWRLEQRYSSLSLR